MNADANPSAENGDGLNIAKTGQEPDWGQLQKQHVYNEKMIKMALPSGIEPLSPP